MKPFIIITVIGIVFSMAFVLEKTLAQTTPTPPSEYELLTPLPGVETSPGSGRATANTYLSGVFILLIAIAGVLAVVMIIVGGIKYMSTDAFSGKNEAKGTIQNAIGGLLLALSAWIILNTINPNLVNINILLPPLAPSETGTGGGGGGGPLPGTPLTPAQVAEDAQIRSTLSNHNPPILVNNPPCINGETTGCTNVVGLPQSAINALLALSTACGCTITITGGAEGGHLTHGPGLARFDLRNDTSLRSFLAQFNPEAANPVEGTRVSRGGATYTFEASPPHWHVSVP